MEKGLPVPVVITVYEDKSFDFIVKTTPASILIKKAAGLQKGSGTPNSLKVGKHISESSYLLGIGKLKTLFKIDLPLLKGALASSFLLIFIDVMKELPLTLILKPYNIETLAISAYAYAEDEMVAEAALPSLVLILIVIILMFILKLDKRNE